MNLKGSPHFALLLALLLSNFLMAQVATDSSITLKDAIQLSEQRNHQLQSRHYETQSAISDVEVAKYVKVPSIDASYQANLATANNLTGMFYPTGLLPMTGPPSASNNFNPAVGSAASILLNWQALTFGQQKSKVNNAIAEANSKKLALEQEKFNNDIGVISKYLDVLLASDKVKVQQQDITRVEVNLSQSKVLAKTGLRPGVDTAFFQSELSKAHIGLLNTKRQLETEQMLLAQLMAADFLPIPSDSSLLTKLPESVLNADSSFVSHPFLQYAKSQMELSQTKEQLLRKSSLPTVTVFGIAFGRGSGVQQDGSIKTLSGLELNRYNYGAGVQLTYPIMKYGEVKRQLTSQNFLTKAANESILQTNIELTTQQRIANTTLVSAINTAIETQQQLKSAQYAFSAMQSRYNTGLVNLSDLAQVQYNLLEAELAVKTSYWDAWKALLLQTFVKGDVNVFLNELK